nr:TnsD family Tn7-like transposition protein [uncultured Deefgea sp.]
MQSLDFRLPIFPDETLYSLIARYHYLLGSRRWRDTIELLCNTPATLLHRSFPSFLNKVNTSLFPEPSISSVIDQLTIFPYFRPFLPERAVEQASAHLVSGHSMGGIKTLLGLVASQIGANTQLRFCPSCMVCDQNQYGQAYWHRMHQLPGIWVCSTHKKILLEVDMKWLEKQLRRLVLPDNKELIEHSSVLPVELAQLEFLFHVAQLSTHILHTNLGVVPLQFWQKLYLQRAEALGFTLPSGRLRLAPLHAYLLASLNQLPTKLEFKACEMPIQNLPNWILLLFRKPRGAYHPLKHLILASGMGFNDEITDVDKFQVIQTAAPKSLEQHIVGRESDELLRQTLAKTGGSLCQAAKLTGISVTTLRLDAARLGLATQTKPQKLTSSIIEQLKHHFIAGLTLNEISTKENISLPTLYRFQRIFPDIANQWRVQREIQERAERRQRYLVSMQKQDYIWLYRHDRTWLQQQIQTHKRPISNSKKRVDWDIRDKQLAKRVTEWAAIEMQAKKRPARVTSSLIGKSLHVAGWLNFYSDKLPLTNEVIKSLIETPDQFYFRRLEWARRELIAKELPIVRWRLLKMASIRPPTSPNIQQYILTLCE